MTLAPHELNPLPEDAVLLHIGVYKTGTTALQAAMANSRAQLREHGVLYPGDAESHHAFYRAAASPDESSAVWERRVKDVRDWSGRVMISSEFFCTGRADTLDRVAEALDPKRLHILVGVRCLAEMLPSAWQQTLKSASEKSYDQWLHENLDGQAKATPKGHFMKFWQRNDYPTIISSWIERVGTDRITVVVSDKSEPDRLFTTVDSLLGLPTGFLWDQRTEHRENRSMTAPEAQLVHELNSLASSQLPRDQYLASVRFGAILRMAEGRRPRDGESPIVTPQWAIDKVTQVGQASAAWIDAAELSVVGDTAAIGSVGAAAIGEQDDIREVPLDVAVQAVLGAIGGSVYGRQDFEQGSLIPVAKSKKSKPGKALRKATTRDMARELSRRTKLKLGRKRSSADNQP